jgi:eukaryotic-like serine/threonine-protein kinase
MTTPGTTLNGNVVLEREIGRGAMGSVWLARHSALQSQVAVKLLQGAAMHSDEARARFAREARAVARISSPHVVHISDFGISGEGQPFIVMELLRGEDLQKRLERTGALPTSEVVSIVGQVCDAITQAHALGVVHRDLKPANVFLVAGTASTFVKVLDFGIAKVEGDHGLAATSADSLVGTPYFMSPEQLTHAGGVDHRADLWAIAVTAYVCLTGRLPFEARGLGELVGAIGAGRFAPPSALRRELPPSVDAWFARAFTPDPNRRFSSAGELASSFAGALGADPALLATAHAHEGALVSSPPPAGRTDLTSASGLAGSASGQLHASAAHGHTARPSLGPKLALAAGALLLLVGATGALWWQSRAGVASANASADDDALDEEDDESDDGGATKKRKKKKRAEPTSSPSAAASAAAESAGTSRPTESASPQAVASTSGARTSPQSSSSSAGGLPPSIEPGLPGSVPPASASGATGAPTATTAASASASATAAPCTCPSVRPRNMVCKKFDATTRCGDCCQPGDIQRDYPDCSCHFDACKLPGSPCR